MHGVLNVDEIKKLITQFYSTLRDEYFEPNYSKFGQLLPNKNKNLQ
jgi:hypothetical protein